MVQQGKELKDIEEFDREVARSSHVTRTLMDLSARSERRRAMNRQFQGQRVTEALWRLVRKVCGIAGLRESEHWLVEPETALRLPVREKFQRAARRAEAPGDLVSVPRHHFPHVDDLDDRRDIPDDERYITSSYIRAERDPGAVSATHDVSRNDHNILLHHERFLSPQLSAGLHSALHNLRHLPRGNLRYVSLSRLLRSEATAVQLAEWTALLIISNMSITSSIWVRVQSMQQVVARLRRVEYYFMSGDAEIEVDEPEVDAGRREPQSAPQPKIAKRKPGPSRSRRGDSPHSPPLGPGAQRDAPRSSNRKVRAGADDDEQNHIHARARRELNYSDTPRRSARLRSPPIASRGTVPRGSNRD